MRNDLERLQGTWRVSSLQVEGEPMPDDMLTEAQITIKGARFSSTGMGAVYEGTMRLDPSATPPHLDMQFDSGPEKGNINLCIYELDGDRWKLCIATRGKVRPAQFASTAGSGIAVETLTRGSAAKIIGRKSADPLEAKPAKAPGNTSATEFEGVWQMVSGVFNGAAMEQSAVRWVKRITVGNETTVKAGPRVMVKVTFTHDSTKSPKTLDYVNMAGSGKGKTQLGIYEFEKNLLKVCMGAPGASRPLKMESLHGEGSTLTVWKRS